MPPNSDANATPHFHDEQAAHDLLVTLFWPNGIACPRCQAKAVSLRPGGRAWRCGACRKDFTVRTGRVFERSHIPLRTWLHAAQLVDASGGAVTSAELGRRLSLRQASAWQIMRRFQAMPEDAARLAAAVRRGAAGKRKHKEKPMALTRQELAGKIYAEIRNGALRNGDKLFPEREIAAHFDTSRGSAREALIILETMGFIEARGKDGFHLRTLSEKECAQSLELYAAWPTEMLPHTFQVRLVLESEAAGLAAQNRTDEDIGRLSYCIDRLEQVRREAPADWNAQGARLNDLFHHQVIEAAHNPVLLRIQEGLLRVINKAYATFGPNVMVTPLEDWEKKIIREHRIILDVIAAGDSREAREIMRRHLEITFKKLDSFYNERLRGVLRQLRVEE